MAIKNNPPSEPQRAVPTPENTPVPGGGRWRWNGAGWTELFETTTLAPTTRDPAPQQPIETPQE